PCDFVTALVERLRADGIPLTRVSTSLPTKHPEVYSTNVIWTPETGSGLHMRTTAVLDTPFFINSPVADLYKGAGPIRCRLAGPQAELRYPVCHDLAARGDTDYLVLPLDLVSGERSFLSFATARPGGFSDEEVARLIAIGPVFAPRVEIEAAYYAMRCL